jgi:hypothetical protein
VKEIGEFGKIICIFLSLIRSFISTLCALKELWAWGIKILLILRLWGKLCRFLGIKLVFFIRFLTSRVLILIGIELKGFFSFCKKKWEKGMMYGVFGLILKKSKLTLSLFKMNIKFK